MSNVVYRGSTFPNRTRARTIKLIFSRGVMQIGIDPVDLLDVEFYFDEPDTAPVALPTRPTVPPAEIRRRVHDVGGFNMYGRPRRDTGEDTAGPLRRKHVEP